ncbi:DUF3060 domain-containing protein [Bosea sp. FBZP-16]|uniref:DUF3060 domain-containing protein n=1 Tax=Bosea sp. FBZP-16 TaxID=2065382 RepID=UPI001319D97F|nr:DUF3060 domain-containing protein [Bosea sp. FBZP-16]
MKPTLSILLVVLAAPTLAVAGEISIAGVGQSRDFTCNGEDVAITGQGHTVELKGSCGAIGIHGSGHKVSFEDSTSLAVSGAQNKANGGSTGSLTVETAENTVSTKVHAGETAAEIDVSGADHTIDLELTGPAKIEVGGVKNSLSWTAAADVREPSISTSGVENRIVRR